MFEDEKFRKNLESGNKNTFRKLFYYYYPRLKAYGVTLVNDDPLAEDIVQDVFLHVWEHRTRFSVQENFQSYLYRAVYTRCMDYFRKAQVKNEYNASVYEAYMKECAELLEQGCAVLNELYSKDFYQELYNLLQQIPEQRREAFLLAYIEGKKTKEIAEQLDIPIRTVESHLYLTLKYLKKKMSKHHFMMFLCSWYIYA